MGTTLDRKWPGQVGSVRHSSKTGNPIPGLVRSPFYPCPPISS